MLLIVLLGILGLFYTQSFVTEMTELAKTDPEQAAARVARMLTIVTVAVGALTIAVGVYLTRLGFRSRSRREFPPPGTWVLRDTLILTGTPAAVLSTIALVLGLLLLGVGVALPVMGSRAIRHLEERDPRSTSQTAVPAPGLQHSLAPRVNTRPRSRRRSRRAARPPLPGGSDAACHGHRRLLLQG